jgi:DNA polymerase-3 subunit gamma/tau
MSYLVFARKFRPRAFASVIGQEHITKALQNAVLRNRIPHALLFTGPRGVGKTTTARLIAATLNCQKLTPDFIKNAQTEDVEPCGECASCRGIASSSDIAVIEIDGASNNGVDDARSLIDSLQSAPPPGSRYKIYIIDEAHMLSKEAWNALLKSLEEPPPNTVFIFATTETHKILETVISRCQRHDFTRINSNLIASSLQEIAQKEGVSVAPDVLALIAKKSVGGMRDAQSMFDRLLSFAAEKIDLNLAKKVFGFVDNIFLQTLTEAILEKDSVKCFNLINDVFSQSLDLRAFCADLVLFWRNLLLVSETKAYSPLLDLTQDEYSELQKLITKTTRLDCLNYFEKIIALADKAILSNYPRYVIEAGLIKMINAGSVKEISEIVAVLESLKKKSNRELDSEVANLAPNKSGNPKLEATLANSSQLSAVKVTPPAAIVRSLEFQEEANNFVPNWNEFLNFVRNKSALMLHSILKRVAPIVFEARHLKIQGIEFELKALTEPTLLNNLKIFLGQYSGASNWIVEFEEIDKPQNAYIDGSVASQEQKNNLDYQQQILNEVKMQTEFKKIFELFPNSKIENVNVLKNKLT